MYPLGDLNDDGQVDAAFQSGDVMFGNRDGTSFSAAASTTVSGRFAVAEFTGDGLPDIIASAASGIVVLANTRSHTNHAPTVSAGPDATLPFSATQGEDCASITAAAADVDSHALTFDWRRDGTFVSDRPSVTLCGLVPGSYLFTVTVRDGRGGVATDSVRSRSRRSRRSSCGPRWPGPGDWSLVEDATAAGGLRAFDPNLGAPKVTAPPAPPASYLALRFFADPTQTYKLWIRLKAVANSWANDSVWVQFSGATDVAGVQKFQIDTTSGLAVNLEECSGCGVSGGAGKTTAGARRTPMACCFGSADTPDRRSASILIQTREDGVSIDQVVLSAEKYLTKRPGSAKNDATILPSTQPPH